MRHFDFTAYRVQVCRAIERAGRDAGALPAALRRATVQAELQLAGSQAGDPGLIACRPGCKSCCVVNVSVLFPEGLAIAAYLQSLPETGQRRIATRLEELWRAVRGLSDDERVSLRRPCAFLDDNGWCLIYPLRPLLCRGVTSTSAERCRQALTDHLFDESSPVLMNLFQRQLFESVYLGVADGLAAAGLEERGVTLTGLVRHLLKKPQAGAALLAGKRIDWHDLA
jgi:Fe-S-cluster containining protein